MKKTLVLNQIASGYNKPAAGHDVTIKDINENIIATAVETPAYSGNYVAEYSETNSFGYWYVDNVLKEGYSNNSPFWLGVYDEPVLFELTVTGESYFQGNIYLSGSSNILSSSISSPTYTSGFGGSGFRLDNGISENGKTSLTIDNLTVRGLMNIYELLIHQIRATNGSLFVSDSAKVLRAYVDGGISSLYFDTGSAYGHPFAVNDLIRHQQWDANKNVMSICNLKVASIISTSSLVAHIISGSINPKAGMEFVRIGNTTDSNRQGSIYLTADDSGAPYIDVYDGIVSHSQFNTAPVLKVRLGKLTGITSPTWGALSGYGLYSTGSIYLDNANIRGIVTITSGSGYSHISDIPKNLSDINFSEGSKLSGIEAGATVGATWGSNLINIPSYLASSVPNNALAMTNDFFGFQF